MKGFLFVDNDKIGEVDFKIVDETMGGIGRQLKTNGNYKKYQNIIQQNCNDQGISHARNLNFRIIVKENIELYPVGGIGVIDIAEYDEIYVELSGVDVSSLEINNK